MSTIESVSNETRVFEPPRDFVAQANVTRADFDRLNAAAAADYPGYWAKLARENLLWHKIHLRSGIYMFKGALTNFHLSQRFDLKYTDVNLLIASQR